MPALKIMKNKITLLVCSVIVASGLVGGGIWYNVRTSAEADWPLQEGAILLSDPYINLPEIEFVEPVKAIKTAQIEDVMAEVPSTTEQIIQEIKQVIVEEVEEDLAQKEADQKLAEQERLRQERCASLGTSNSIDQSISVAQKDVDDMTQYVADFDNPESQAYKLWKTAGGRDVEYYRQRLAEIQAILFQSQELKNKWLAERADCGL